VAVPNRGVFVEGISLKGAEDLFEIREALEILGVEKAVKNCDETFLSALKAHFAEFRSVATQTLSRQRILIDQRFHLLIAKQTDNVSLHDMLQHVFERITLTRKTEGAPRSRGVITFDEDVAILQAIRDGDAQRAKELIGLHVRNARAGVLQQLQDRQLMLDR